MELDDWCSEASAEKTAAEVTGNQRFADKGMYPWLQGRCGCCCCGDIACRMAGSPSYEVVAAQAWDQNHPMVERSQDDGHLSSFEPERGWSPESLMLQTAGWWPATCRKEEWAGLDSELLRPGKSVFVVVVEDVTEAAAAVAVQPVAMQAVAGPENVDSYG